MPTMRDYFSAVVVGRRLCDWRFLAVYADLLQQDPKRCERGVDDALGWRSKAFMFTNMSQQAAICRGRLRSWQRWVFGRKA
jgi:hypothetical protein